MSYVFPDCACCDFKNISFAAATNCGATLDMEAVHHWWAHHMQYSDSELCYDQFASWSHRSVISYLRDHLRAVRRDLAEGNVANASTIYAVFLKKRRDWQAMQAAKAV